MCCTVYSLEMYDLLKAKKKKKTKHSAIRFCPHLVWPEGDKSVCVRVRLCACVLQKCVTADFLDGKSASWKKTRITWTLSMCFGLTFPALLRKLVSLSMVTKAHGYMPEHTHTHTSDRREQHTHNNHTHNRAHALKPEWGIYVHYPLSSLCYLSQAGWCWSVKKINSRPAESAKLTPLWGSTLRLLPSVSGQICWPTGWFGPFLSFFSLKSRV